MIMMKFWSVIACLILTFLSASLAAATTPAVCKTDRCVQQAEKIKSTMDFTADPCDDFYQYSCGKWMKDTPIPDGKKSVTLTDFGHASEPANLFENYDDPLNPVWPKLKTFYDTCMNTEAIEKLGASPLKPYLDQFSKLFPSGKLVPDSLTDVIIFLSQFLYGQKLVRPTTLRTRIKFDKYRPLVAYEYFTATQARKKQVNLKLALKNLFEAVFTDPALSWEQEDFGAIAQEQVHLDVLLSAVVRKTKGTGSYTSKNYEQLSGGVFNMNKFLQSIGASNVDGLEVTVPYESYFSDIMAILQTQSPRAVKYFFLLHFVETTSVFLNKKISEAYWPLGHEEYYEPKRGTQRMACSTYTQLIFDLAWRSTYNRHIKLSQADVDAVHDMFNKMKDQMQQRLEKVTWLDKKRIEVVSEQLKTMKDIVALQKVLTDGNFLTEYYSTLEVSSTSSFDNAMNALKFMQKNVRYDTKNREIEGLMPPYYWNAYSDGSHNLIYVLSGMLKSSYFVPKDLPSMQYGGLGYVIGHEMTHGVTDRQMVAIPGFDVEKWNSTSYEKFAQCFSDQYSKFKIPLNPEFVDGTYTIGEVLADNNGLQLSWDAWNLATTTRMTLPGLPDVTEEQLFFIKMGQTWCEKKTKDMYSWYNYDSHPPMEVRVRGMAMNSPEFSKAFKCKANTKMNPTKKCTLY